MIYHSTAPHCAESDINNEAVNMRMDVRQPIANANEVRKGDAPVANAKESRMIARGKTEQQAG